MTFVPKDWVDAAGEAAEAGNLNDIEARIKAALPAFSQHVWTQKTSTTPLSSAAIEDLEVRVTNYTDGVMPGFYNVQKYGALGNNFVHDDTAAFNACAAACKKTGGIFYVPSVDATDPTLPAKYKVTDSVLLNKYVNGVSGSEHFSFWVMGASGEGQQNVQSPEIRYYGANDTKTVLDCRSVHGFKMSGLKVSHASPTDRGSANPYTGRHIDCAGDLASDTINCTIEDIGFNDYTSGTAGDETAECNIYMNKVIISSIGKGCSFGGAQYGIKTGTSYIVQVTIGGGHMLLSHAGSGTSHIQWFSTDSEAVLFTDITSEGGTNTGFFSGETGHQFYGVKFHNIWVGDLASGPTIVFDGLRLTRGPGIIDHVVSAGMPAGALLFKLGEKPGPNNNLGNWVVKDCSMNFNVSSLGVFSKYSNDGIGSLEEHNNIWGNVSTVWVGTPIANYTVNGLTQSSWPFHMQQVPTYTAAGSWSTQPTDTSMPDVAGFVVGGSGGAASVYPIHPAEAARHGIYSQNWSGGGRGVTLVGSANGNGRVVLAQASAGVGTQHVPVIDVRGTNLGVSQIGVLGATPRARNTTSFTLNSGAKAHDLPSGATLSQIEQVLRQVITYFGDTSGFGWLDDTT